MKEGKMEGKVEGKVERKVEGKAERPQGRKAERQKGRKAERHAERHAEREGELATVSGNVMGRRPLGFTSPNKISAKALPVCSPAKKMLRIASVSWRHSVKTAPGVESSTTY
jgi:hypothetical protein